MSVVLCVCVCVCFVLQPLSKEVRQLRDYESALLKAYQVSVL